MRRIALAVTFLLIAFVATATAQWRQLFMWNVRIEEARSAAEARTYIIYGSRESIDLYFWFENDEGPLPIAVTPATLLNAVAMQVKREGQPIDVGLSWRPTGSWKTSPQANAVAIEQPIQLQTGDSLNWRVSLRLRDGGAWPVGQYELAIDMTTALTTLSIGDRTWDGRAQTDGRLKFEVVPTDAPAARKASYMLKAGEATLAARPDVAVEMYRAALKEDPADRNGYGGLGLALSATGQFKEAVAALEIVLPFSLEGKQIIPDTLAHAYLMLGDERNAVRVLRMVTPEPHLQARLDRLKAAAKKTAAKTPQ